jgi:hypothetical protein
MTMIAEGYEAEPSDADTVWEALVGKRGDDDEDMQWWVYLSSRLALLAEVQRRIHAERSRVAASWHAQGDSFAVIGQRVGLTRARAQQLVEQGRQLAVNGRGALTE